MLLLELILYIAVSIGIALIIRELVMWYWKINVMIENQNRQSALLDSILEEIKKNKQI